MTNKTDFSIPDPSEMQLENVYKLAVKHAKSKKLTDYQMFVLFGFDWSEWDAHMDWILGASRKELIEWVNNQEIEDENGNSVGE